ncbi:MAG: alpha-amylase family glycosyl hydrolase [Omnitrophica WOR_2 bacterium]
MNANIPITSVSDIDLTPLPGKINHSFEREWREEFIYFLMVDRFHDDAARAPVRQSGRSNGIQAPDDFYGGTLNGIRQNLDYIAGLGCTAIWLSPVFQNNDKAYHGYNINNYLNIDPHFGTKQDLIDLVEAAHQRNPPMRVILDVVINHSGDNWAYPGDYPYYYSSDQRFPLGFWRQNDLPVPTELRDETLYHRMGQIHSAGGWDAYPENQHGDVVTLKDYANDDDEPGSILINILIKAHCYWIREADVDGFRVDAVKHMGELACSRFCSNIREYAYTLGKRGFFLYGEVASPDDALLDRYIGQNTSRQDGDKTVFFGLDSVLDFRLANDLPWVLKGFNTPQPLIDRLDAQRDRALNRGEIGRYLVTFVDNHDSFWQPNGRFANGATDDQVIAAIGYLLCSLGTPCIYYGTEQGFSGHGGDNAMREAMFDRDTPGTNLLNPDCTIYTQISCVAGVMRSVEPLRFGRIYMREISGDGVHFGFPYGNSYTLAFSRILYPCEVLVAYNVSDQPRDDRVIIDHDLHQPGERMRFLYGAAGDVAVETSPDGARFVHLPLGAHQFVILE